MKCEVVIHPIAQQHHLLETVSNLRSRNYVVPSQPGKRFVRAYPDTRVDAQITKNLRALSPDWKKYLKENL
jgi:hypothetical protein